MSPRRCPAADGRPCPLGACSPADRCAEQLALEDRMRATARAECPECGGDGTHFSGCLKVE